MTRPWQVDVFEHGLKKRQKLALLRRQLGPLDAERCVLLTCGDNNGALNLRLHEHGGRWTWMEMETSAIPALSDFLGEVLGDEVLEARPDALPAEDGSFDVVVAVDAHEHVDDPRALARELARIAAPGARVVVTTPGGGNRRPINALKRLLGMDDAAYGHRVDGLDWGAHEALLRSTGLEPIARGSYSRAFTEAIELALNFFYVKVLGTLSGRRSDGEIAPRTASDLGRVGGAYRLYRALFPLLRAVAALDVLVPFRGYAVSVVARKPRTSTRTGES